MKGHEEIWPSAKQQGWRDEKAAWLLQPTLEHTNFKFGDSLFMPLHVLHG